MAALAAAAQRQQRRSSSAAASLAKAMAIYRVKAWLKLAISAGGESVCWHQLF